MPYKHAILYFNACLHPVEACLFIRALRAKVLVVRNSVHLYGGRIRAGKDSVLPVNDGVHSTWWTGNELSDEKDHFFGSALNPPLIQLHVHVSGSENAGRQFHIEQERSCSSCLLVKSCDVFSCLFNLRSRLHVEKNQ